MVARPPAAPTSKRRAAGPADDAPRAGAGRPSGRGAFQFDARLRRVGTFFAVDVPAPVSRALGVRGPVYVIGTVDGAVPLRTSLSPAGGGRHLLFLNAEIRREAGLVEGDRVRLRFARDDDPRLPLPDDLANLLREEGALAAFEALPVGARNQLLRAVEEAVHPATRDKRLARAVEVAFAARERKLDREARRPAAPTPGPDRA
jgi:hypothetical protein